MATDIEKRDFGTTIDGWITDTLSRLQQPIGEEFGGSLTDLRTPLMDLQETDKEFIAKLDVPGVERKEITVTPRPLGIEVKATHANEKEEKTKRVYRFERSEKGYYRYFSLPETAETERAKARLMDGVLVIRVPKTHRTAANRTVEVM